MIAVANSDGLFRGGPKDTSERQMAVEEFTSEIEWMCLKNNLIAHWFEFSKICQVTNLVAIILKLYLQL